MTLIDYIKANPDATDAEILAERNAPVTTGNAREDRWLTWNRIELLFADNTAALAEFAAGFKAAADANPLINARYLRIVAGPGVDMSLEESQIGVEQMVGVLIDQATADLFKSIGFITTQRNETQADVDAARAELAEEARLSAIAVRRAWLMRTHGEAMQMIEAGATVEAIKAFFADKGD